MSLRSTCVNPDNFELHEEAITRLDYNGISLFDARVLLEAEILSSGGGGFSGSVVRFMPGNKQEGEGFQLSPVDDNALHEEIKEARRQEAEILVIREQLRQGINGVR